MVDEPLKALVEDIRPNGLQEPIVTYQGQILDGRIRDIACRTAGVSPRFVPFEGNDPIGFVLSKNLHRRHAMVAAGLANLGRGRPENASIEAITQAEAARLLNVSRSTVQRAATVRDNAAPALANRVQRGDIPVSLAAGLAANLSEEQQRELASPPEAVLRGAVKRVVRARREQALDSATAQASAALSVQLYSIIMADPPWRFEPFCAKRSRC
jgi:ParB-like chromosome segregation protein Spo0J